MDADLLFGIAFEIQQHLSRSALSYLRLAQPEDALLTRCQDVVLLDGAVAFELPDLVIPFFDALRTIGVNFDL